ncbi:hypothetical protein [Lentzea pudingi]|uniref:hypothetical protein n=1 Tax=Lentzea pudingi TaxID=1789439 RepID=UPI00166997AC|nr:hypothetical protein [Lentzea pudingi]
MNADDRILLLDLENLGSARLRPRPLRSRLEALLNAAGDIHHAVAAYALPDVAETDPLASVLAELRVAPLRVTPGADAAELALLAHARHVHTEGGRVFLVGSADGRFAELATLGRVELFVWDGQPVAAKLADVAHDIHRLARTTGAPTDDPTGPEQNHPDEEPLTPLPRPADRHGSVLVRRLLIAVAAGVGIALGQRLVDFVVPPRGPQRR